MTTRVRTWLLAMFVGVLPVEAALAQLATMKTLDKIAQYRTIYVGRLGASVPFSYLVENEAVGYSKELCDRIVDEVRRAIKDPALRVEQVHVTSSSRLLMLQAGMIDLECGATTNTKLRQQSVAFSVTTFVSGVKALVRKDSSIERLADLNNKVVATVAGSSAERLVKTVLAAHKATARGKSARNQNEGLEIVLARQADAFVLDDAVMAGLLASSPDAGQLRLLEENFGFEPYGITLRKDDPEFKKLVDDTLKGLMKSGEFARIYNKWFMSPIPPKNINLQIPMSDLLKDLIRNPNDAGI